MTDATARDAPAPGTPRERARAQTISDIIRLGRRHLATHGAAALSLRAVARDLGVVSSAVYRYVANRDELLTLLLVDAYSDLGDTVDAAIAEKPDNDYAGRFYALGKAVRGWALHEPARYGLLFGSPVPGYQAPAGQTTAPGTRVIFALIGIFAGAYRAGELAPEGSAAVVHPALSADLEAVRSELGVELPDAALATGALVWTSLFGAVSFEVFGQYGADTFSAPDELFEHHLTVLAQLAGFRSQ
jgi:AcrR family transcriptional regulator